MNQAMLLICDRTIIGFNGVKASAYEYWTVVYNELDVMIRSRNVYAVFHRIGHARKVTETNYGLHIKADMIVE
jgi:hypothetical protein